MCRATHKLVQCQGQSINLLLFLQKQNLATAITPNTPNSYRYIPVWARYSPHTKGPGLPKRKPSAAKASSSGGTFKAAALRAAKVAVAADKQASRTTGSGTQGDARGRTGGTAARGAGGKRTRSPSEEQLSDASQAEGTQAAGDDGAGARGEEVRVRGVVRAHTHTQLPIASTCVLRLRALPEPQLRADEVTTPCMAHASSCRCCATSLTLRHR